MLSLLLRTVSLVCIIYVDIEKLKAQSERRGILKNVEKACRGACCLRRRGAAVRSR
jgi:hypothetical protein